MADSVNRLARLKALKSGLKAKQEEPDQAEPDTFSSIDAMLEEEMKAASPPAPAPDAAPAPASTLVQTDTAKDEDDPESLAAYFEALGLVPSAAKTQSQTDTPAADAMPVEPAPVVASPKAKGRDVDIRDRWADPVREDDAYLTSFAGMETPTEPLVSASRTPEPVAAPAAEDVPRAEPVEPSASSDTPAQFGRDIDIEAFEQELLASDKSILPLKGDTAETPAPAELDSSSENSLSVYFDPSRAAALEQVSQHMGCTIDDVVITAVDWYLDALSGDEGAAADADYAE